MSFELWLGWDRVGGYPTFEALLETVRGIDPSLDGILFAEERDDDAFVRSIEAEEMRALL